jgi:tetratricopeptide (TPR) repeat protein
MYRRAIRNKPGDYAAHYQLGVLLAQQGKLDEALAAYGQALRRMPGVMAPAIVKILPWDFRNCPDPKARDPKRAADLLEQALAAKPGLGQRLSPELFAGCAPLLLLGDRAQTYRGHCARLFGQFQDTKDPRTAYLVARSCALAPDAGPDPARLVELAERAAQDQPAPHYLHTLGLAHYRAGQYDRAVEQLERSLKKIWQARAANWLVLAMAHQRLGHADEARKWFDQAVRWMESTGSEAAPGPGEGLRSLHPHDALACLVLRREAGALVKAQSLLRTELWPVARRHPGESQGPNPPPRVSS